MPTRRLLLSLFLFLLLGGVAGVAGVWFFFFSGEAPDAASIDHAANSIGASSNQSGQSGSIDGTWKIDSSIGNFSDFSSTYAGFRVAEVLDNIGDSLAIGRTPVVTGSLALSDQSLTAAHIDVQLAAITSDRPRRDPAIQQALETTTFPTATFDLTNPISLQSAPTEGVTYDLTAHGTLTIHGVTKAAEIALQARLVSGVIVVVGSADLTFSDYGVAMPRAPIVLSVANDGQIEFQLFFTKSL